MSSFAYSVAIKLSVANLASQGVKILAADLLKAHGAATNLQSKLSALKMVAVGYGLEKAGQGMLGFLGKAIEGSKEYTHQIALMNAAGFTHRELAESIGSAWKATGSVITTTAAQNLETIRELRSAFGKGEGMEHAYAVLPQVQRVSSILESVTGRKQTHVGFDMVKAIELGTKGALSVDSLMRQSEMMSKALVQMGGTLTVSDFHQAIKQTRAIAPYMSDDFKYNYLPTLIQEMKTGPNGGAQQAGTAIASLGQVVVGQMIPKALISNWVDAGLINPKMVVTDKHNRGTSKVLAGGVAGQNEFGANPYLWAQKYAAPAVEKLMASKHLDQYGAILSLTHNRVAAFALQTLINKGAQFERDRKLITEGPSSYASYQQLLKRDPQMAEQAMHSQWQNLLAIVGYQILPKMIPFMIQFANGLNTISTWMAAHPLRSSTLVIGLGILGVALDLAGKALMAAGIIKFLGLGPMIARGFAAIAAVLGGPVALAIGAVTVVGLLVWNNWKEIKASLIASFNDFKAGLTKLFHGDILGAFGSFSIIFVRGWQTVLNTLIAGINTILPAALQISKLSFADHYAGSVNGESPFVRKPAAQGHLPGSIYLDGKKVGQIVTGHQTRAAGRPNTGSSSFDGSQTPWSIAAVR